MSAYLGYLRCPRCGTHVEESHFMFGCPRCASESVPVNVHPDYSLAATTYGPPESGQGIFTRRTLLPLSADIKPVSLGEGNTPLIHMARTGASFGMDALFLKDETRNPTWSYKDRLAAVAVTKAAADGADTVTVSTTGNHGAASAAYAAAAGLRCVALTLSSVPLTMKVLMQAYGAEVLAVEHPPDRWALMDAAVREWGWVPLSGLLDPPIGSNPFGIDGYKTIAYELFDQLEEAPDVVIVPIAYGDGLTGIARGFDDLKALGVIDTIPRMVAAEPLGPYSASMQSTDGVLQTVPFRPSVAFSTAGANATYQGVATLKNTEGTAVVVDDDTAIITAQTRLASEEGIYLEASAVTAVLAAATLRRQDWVAADDLVVAIGTSSGLKDIDATAAQLPSVPVIEPTLSSLSATLAHR